MPSQCSSGAVLRIWEAGRCGSARGHACRIRMWLRAERKRESREGRGGYPSILAIYTMLACAGRLGAPSAPTEEREEGRGERGEGRGERLASPSILPIHRLASSRSQLRFFAERLEERRPALRRICCEATPWDPAAPADPVAPGEPKEPTEPWEPWAAWGGGAAPPQLEGGAMQPRRVSCW